MAHKSLASAPLFLHLLLMAFFIPSAVPALELPAIPAVPTDLATPTPESLPVEIPMTDSHLRYIGRWEKNDVASTCAWPASALTLRFQGTALNARLDLGYNRCEVVVDGLPVKVLAARTRGSQLYALASGLKDAAHTVTLVKCTEAAVGSMRVLGFELNAGARLLDVPAVERHIEVIGDSISAGFGNEAASANESFSPATENAYWAYGARTARAFGADYVCLAWSGKCLWPDDTLPELYDFALPTLPRSEWKFDGPKPQVVMINLCTNDFYRGTPREDGWVKAYRDFITRVRRHAPEATIYLALGSMLTDVGPAGGKPLSRARAYIQRVAQETQEAGDAKVHFIEFAPQEAKDGFGAQMHPNLKTHALMAQDLIRAIEKDLGWKPVTDQP